MNNFYRKGKKEEKLLFNFINFIKLDRLESRTENSSINPIFTVFTRTEYISIRYDQENYSTRFHSAELVSRISSLATCVFFFFFFAVT